MTTRWLLVLFSASALVTISLGIRQSMGLFLGPISLDLNTGRELFSFAVALQNLLWGYHPRLSGPWLTGSAAGKSPRSAAFSMRWGLWS